MMLLAMDANFRLKNRLRANEHQDPSLASGLGYFIEEKGYKDHGKNYVAEKDVSEYWSFLSGQANGVSPGEQLHCVHCVAAEGDPYDDRAPLLRGGRVRVCSARRCSPSRTWGSTERRAVQYYLLHFEIGLFTDLAMTGMLTWTIYCCRH
jgi:hypothetical protein